MGSVADLLVSTLALAGVKRVYGVAGDSLNGITDSIRKRGDIGWVPVRHEEMAAFAAGAEAHLTGRLAVCAGSCGPGNLHLINGLYDCASQPCPRSGDCGAHSQPRDRQRLLPGDPSRAPVPRVQPLLRAGVATGADAPHPRDRDADRDCHVAVSQWWSCRATSPCSLPLVSEPRLKLSPRRRLFARPTDEIDTVGGDAERARERSAILGGAGCAGAHAELIGSRRAKLKAPIVHAMRGKEFIEYDNPYDVGMTGLLGFSSGYHAMMDCDVC